MPDGIVFVNEFNRKDWFGGVKRGCFLDARSQLSQPRHKKREALLLTTRKLLDQSFLRQCEKAIWKAAVPTANGISCSCSDLNRTVSNPCFAKHPSASHISLDITADATMPILKSRKAFDLSHPSNGLTRSSTRSCFERFWCSMDTIRSGGRNPCHVPIQLLLWHSPQHSKSKQTQT